MQISSYLRRWFVVHFVVDIIFAIPLLFFPTAFLSYIGLFSDPLFARLIGAALLAIGTTSLLMRKGTYAEYLLMLHLKIIWSVVAIGSLLWSLFYQFNLFVLIILLVFIGFSSVWIYFRMRLN